MSLAIFDLDNTLIAGDSDYLWGRFLVEQGIVNQAVYEDANSKFYQQYREGTLVIEEFLHFALRPLKANGVERLYEWREQFVEEKIQPILLDKATALVEKHRASGDTLMVITATNRFVTEPIVGLYGIENLLATTPEFINGRFSGRFTGTPCFQEGKVENLEAWLKQNNNSLNGSWFYSDSHNDLPLLQRVSHPVAVDPDDTLKRFAEQADWQILSLRD